MTRIKALAIPPAWTDVWICSHADGHIQATGRDAKGRKQYRYHRRWREVRDENKYNRMIAFGRALPKIRQRVHRDLRQPGLGREKVLAAIVHLLELSAVRVGNSEYASHNKSYGLTTLRNHHARVNGSSIHLRFRGKGGKEHALNIDHPRLSRIVQKCQDLPGQDLFVYIADDGVAHDVTSGDVNDYLLQIAGEAFTSKDFRTWTGTVLAAQTLCKFDQISSLAKAKRNIVSALERVAERLGNTPSVCKKCYVHPAVLDSYLDGSLPKPLPEQTEGEMHTSLRRLRPEEAAVVALLRRKLKKSENGELGKMLRRSLIAVAGSKSSARSRRRSALTHEI